MTFSLIARCAVSGQFGMVISSSSPAVASRCSHLRAGVGAVASQNITDPALGPILLSALSNGAKRAMAEVIADRPFIDYRQLLAIDARGETAIHSGTQVLGIWGQATGRDCAAAGNLLADTAIPQGMVAAFEGATGAFGDRLMAALQAGLHAGGEAGPVHSAGLKIVDQLDWPVADLRIDWADDPIGMLQTAWDVFAPQMSAYVQRALNPSVAPSYGVAGDE
jgi:uncharacterized Ntn-hydrolase superfamily protein